MDLVPYMYYESQEPGSQLCAQHCLNNVLQQYTYSEFDLAEIAKKLDQAENAALAPSNQNKKSYNLDDTGFFSISVLERALEVWDLALVRWRGEAMKPYQEHPEEQAAFILNLSSHWLPLRRFSPHPAHQSATKRWYNLNSFLPNGPEWISPTYLRLVLAQAEEEGYSVFVIRKAVHGGAEGHDIAEGQGWKDGGIGVLPECEADRIAFVLGEPVGRTGAGNAGGLQSATSATGPGKAGPSRSALPSTDQPTVDPSSTAGPSSPPARRRKRQEDLTLDDPLALATDEFAQIAPAPRSRQVSRGNSTFSPITAHTTTAPIPSGDEPKDIFDSEAFPSIDNDETMSQGDAAHEEDEDVIHDEDDGFARYGTTREDMYGGPTDFTFHSRSYDDEDEALQAALKASMNDIPDGWVAPQIMKDELPKPAPPALAPPVQSTLPKQSRPEEQGQEQGKKEMVENIDEDEDDDRPTEELTPDEIRRRRLARFGM